MLWRCADSKHVVLWCYCSYSVGAVALLLPHRWFDDDKNSSGRLGSSLSTDAASIRGAVGDVFGMVVQNLACMVAGTHHAMI